MEQPGGDAPRLLLHLLTPLVLGVTVQAIFEPRARAWHGRLRKAPDRPPALAFPLVWTYCYLCMGYAAHVLSRANAARAVLGRAQGFATSLPAHAAHFVLVHTWQVVFMGTRNIRGGLLVLLALDIFVPPMLAAWFLVAPVAACLMLPYLAWLLLLTYCNWYMLEHNPDWREADKEEVRRLHGTPRGASPEPMSEEELLQARARRRANRPRDEALVPVGAD